MNREDIYPDRVSRGMIRLMDKVPVGIAEFTYQKDFKLLYANTAFFAIMGISREAFLGNGAGLAALCADAVEREELKAFIETRDVKEAYWEMEYQRRLPEDRRVKWIYLQLASERGKMGEEIFRGVFTDITKLRQSGLPLDFGGDEYKIMSRFTGRSLFEYNIASKTMKYMSPFAKEFSGNKVIYNYRETALKENLVFPEDIPVFHKLCDYFDCGRALIEEELRLVDETGLFVWCKVQAAAICGQDGRPLKVIGKVENIDLQKRENEQLKEKSKRDPLTNFYNKVVIEEAVDAYLAENPREKGAFMVIDIDNFKRINDTQGHLFGDSVLCNIAGQLRSLLRSGDLLGRVGGDEFVAFLKEVRSFENVEKKAREICGAFRRLHMGEDGGYMVSCSIGIALYPEHGENYRALFAKADRALYKTKDVSKNNFTVYGLPKEGGKALPERKKQLQKSLLQEGAERKKLSLIRVFELLFDTKDICYSINMVIESIGEYYGFDRVFILESTKKDHGLLTYEWCREGVCSRRDQESSCLYGMERREMLFCEDVDAASFDEKRKEELKKHGVKSFVRYALHENGKLSAMIAFEVCRDGKVWLEEEIENLMIISKFIGSYLTKMQVQNEVEKLAYTDPLTGMWNFNKFKLAAESMLAKAREQAGKRYAMICFDIKKFRYINDTFGFDVGDEILLFIARRIKEIREEEMIFTRRSADKFLVLTAFQNEQTLLAALEAGMERIQYFTSAKTGRYKLVFNAGIYLIEREDMDCLNAIIDKADIARGKAQRSHDNKWVLYCDIFRQNLMKEKEIEDLVDTAMESKEFVVYYQPKVDLLTGAIKGAEALVRWVSPSKGFMSPADFIPLFEKNGFIAQLDFYVFERVFADLRRWMNAKKKIVPISVNLSRVHLSDGTFIERMVSLLDRYGVNPENIEIELTESVFMENIASIIEVMQQLKDIGFSISIDDFGSGYSSLRLLRDLPVDYLKLDKEFLDNGDSNIREQIIIMNVIRMAKTLGIKVVSEGVETMTQATFLKSCACDLAQGFLYDRPMPVSEFEKKI